MNVNTSLFITKNNYAAVTKPPICGKGVNYADFPFISKAELHVHAYVDFPSRQAYVVY